MVSNDRSSRVVDSIGDGERVTVNALAGRLDMDPRLVRLALLDGQSRGLVTPDPAYVMWVRTSRT